MKVGDYTFEAVKYALIDHVNRVGAVPEQHGNSHILGAAFDGGVLDGKSIHFSPELNTLIGIRGSGKSSILEAIRYALDIPFGDKALDLEYKKLLVGHVLGSGGKVTIQAVDQRGQHYEIRRIHGESPDVYVDGVLQPGVSIRETILQKPIYFGQKDLSSTGEGFEKDLVEKLVGEKLTGLRSRIETQRQKVSEIVARLKDLVATGEKKAEYISTKQNAEFNLNFYRKYGIEEKLQKQLDYDADSRKSAQVVSFAKSYLSDLEEFINRYEDDLKNERVYSSRHNQPFFESFFLIYDKLLSGFGRIANVHADGRNAVDQLREKAGEFEKTRAGLKEEFAEIERKLAEELRDTGAKAIRPDEFRQLRQTVEQAGQMIEALDRQESQGSTVKQELLREMARLNDLWHEEYKVIRIELDKINKRHPSLAIKAEFKANGEALVAFMKDIFRGSHIRETTFTNLAASFSDFGDMYKEFEKAKNVVGNMAQTFEEYFKGNLTALLTWQVPNRFVIEYRGKELKHHSLGQRASALILFVLSQQENHVLLIDQPEDDLDNQTIYEDVIKLLRELKPLTQFIFATHNANFPVLGDAEQIIACEYSDDRVSVTCGSIDSPAMQQAVVDIMEGGEEAFRQRKRIYEIWKPLNF